MGPVGSRDTGTQDALTWPGPRQSQDLNWVGLQASSDPFLSPF